MIKPETIALVANLASIVSSFSLVSALYLYIKDRYERNRRFDFSIVAKRKRYYSILCKNPALIDKVVIGQKRARGVQLKEVLVSRYHASIYSNREAILRNGLKFIFSDEAVQSLPIFDSEAYDNIDTVLSRFCSLVVDREGFYTPDCKKVDAWISLANIKQFVVKFPVPKDLFDDKVFSDMRYSDKTISSFGNKVICECFLPYLIFYVAINYSDFVADDTSSVFSVAWELGPS